MPRDGRIITTVWIGLAAAVLLWGAIAPLGAMRHIADEATYIMMAYSLGMDGDAIYTPRDLRRAYDIGFKEGPRGMFLTRKSEEAEWHYSKQRSYPLYLAPFVKFFGVNGVYMGNLLALLGVVFSGWAVLRDRFGNTWAAFASWSFFGLTLPILYTHWAMAEIFDAFLMVAGTAFWLSGPGKGADSSKRDRFFPNHHVMISMALIGVAAYNKPPNAIVVPFILLSELATGGAAISNLRRLAVACLFFIAPIILFTAFDYKAIGEFSIRGGDRKVFTEEFPYQEGLDENRPLRGAYDCEWHSEEKTILDRLKSRLPSSPELVEAIPGFFTGRYAGQFIYMPGLLVFLLLGLWRLATGKADPRTLFIIATYAGGVALWLVFMKNNYHGGVGTIGNRYYFPVSILLFFVAVSLSKRQLVVAAVLTAVLSLPAAYRLNVPPRNNLRNMLEHLTHAPFSMAPAERMLTAKLYHFGSRTDNRKRRAFYLLKPVPFLDESTFRGPVGRPVEGLFVQNSVTEETPDEEMITVFNKGKGCTVDVNVDGDVKAYRLDSTVASIPIGFKNALLTDGSTSRGGGMIIRIARATITPRDETCRPIYQIGEHRPAGFNVFKHSFDARSAIASEGLGGVERWGGSRKTTVRWSRSASTTLLLPSLDEKTKRLYEHARITVRLFPHPKIKKQRMDLLLNDVFIDSKNVDRGWDEYTWRVPVDAWDSARRNRLAFRYGETTRPGPRDARTLAVAFDWISVDLLKKNEQGSGFDGL